MAQNIMRTSILCVAGLALAFVLVAAATGAPAQDSTLASPTIAKPARPGIGPHDDRVRVDPNTAPWRAVGKLQVAAASWYSACTGTLIGPALVLTAAHCVFNEHAGQFYRPAALHFLIGADGDRYAGHAQIVSYVIGTGYDHAKPEETLGSDWALLTLDTKLGTPDRILALRAAPPAIGASVMIGGYSEDHRYILTADEDCRVTGEALDAHGKHVLRHDCTGTRGVSGAPLLVEEQGVWRVGGVAVAAQMGASVGFAVTLDDVQKHL
jgi:protease YdgD